MQRGGGEIRQGEHYKDSKSRVLRYAWERKENVRVQTRVHVRVCVCVCVSRVERSMQLQANMHCNTHTHTRKHNIKGWAWAQQRGETRPWWPPRLLYSLDVQAGLREGIAHSTACNGLLVGCQDVGWRDRLRENEQQTIKACFAVIATHTVARTAVTNPSRPTHQHAHMSAYVYNRTVQRKPTFLSHPNPVRRPCSPLRRI